MPVKWDIREQLYLHGNEFIYLPHYLDTNTRNPSPHHDSLFIPLHGIDLHPDRRVGEHLAGLLERSRRYPARRTEGCSGESEQYRVGLRWCASLRQNLFVGTHKTETVDE